MSLDLSSHGLQSCGSFGLCGKVTTIMPFARPITNMVIPSTLPSSSIETNYDPFIGPFVRVNYREVSVCNDQAARKILYPALDKGAWYKIFAMPDSSYVNYMSQLNAKKCLVLGKKITKGYSLNTVLGFEDRIDYAINLFKFGFDKACARGSVSLNEWFAYLTFDVVSLATFSKEFGFLRAEKDIGGSIANSEKLLWYLAIMGYFTKVHDWLEAFMLPLMKWFDLQPMRHVMGTTEKALKAREGIEEAGRDMLSHWKSQKEGNRLTDRDVFGLASTNVAAGGDTVGAESQAFVYYMLRNPDKLLKLREEIDKAASEGRISNPVQYKEALALPYFQACVRIL